MNFYTVSGRRWKMDLLLLSYLCHNRHDAALHPRAPWSHQSFLVNPRVLVGHQSTSTSSFFVSLPIAHGRLLPDFASLPPNSASLKADTVTRLIRRRSGLGQSCELHWRQESRGDKTTKWILGNELWSYYAPIKRAATQDRLQLVKDAGNIKLILGLPQ